jgi:ATP-dependent DNA helicase RecG
VGTRALLLGKIKHDYGYRRMSSPQYSILSEDDTQGGIQPIYHANSDISSGWVRRFVREALQRYPGFTDPVPATLRIQSAVMSRQCALRAVHFPSSMSQVSEARRRLAFEEVLFLQLHLLQARMQRECAQPAIAHCPDGPLLQALMAKLPFDLTADQQQAQVEILADMAAARSMNRLLLGDVGSGKTVVAAIALAVAADSGCQAAMMAPTEVLAQQYALKIGPLFDAAGITWDLLTSSTSTAQRTTMLQQLASGRIQVLFGTHALIEADVSFDRLSLVVIDEQHRFGVAQREALRAKGPGSDYLTMTATPIPRSLALTIYGDLDITTIQSRPRASARIVTHVLTQHQLGEAYDALRRTLERGEQAYIVCPLIEAPSAGARAADQQHLDSEPEQLITEYSTEVDRDHITAAEEELVFLRRQVFPNAEIALMTSRLKPAEKRQTMDAFRAGEIDILVSTTVIEVGVDVPNATAMIIQNADRFGLSQLHQLRGRVGRGEADGEVYLIAESLEGDAGDRLRALEQISDGFQLAEKDLELRQEGNVLGSRQHGAALLKLVNVIRDARLIEYAHQQARLILEQDPQLTAPEHRLLASELNQIFAGTAD